jgi:hypothetical protein
MYCVHTRFTTAQKSNSMFHQVVTCIYILLDNFFFLKKKEEISSVALMIVPLLSKQKERIFYMQNTTIGTTILRLYNDDYNDSRLV